MTRATWPDAPDIDLSLASEQWHGIGDGHGHLSARHVVVDMHGRRAAARARQVSLWLPAPGGGVAAVEELAEVRPRVPTRSSNVGWKRAL